MFESPRHSRTPWLTEGELNPKFLYASQSLAEAVTMFQSDADLRLLPILDRNGRPLGAIFEREIRRLLLNPFGHALLLNPTFGAAIGPHIRPCPTHEMTNDINLLVDAYHKADGREGMILTVGNRLFATLTNRRLLLLAAEEQQRASRRRLERAERIERTGARFEGEAASMSRQMVELANAVQRLAEATADRAAIAGDQATSVAGAALQTRDSLSHLSERGLGLAAAFEQIEQSVASNRTTAARSVERVTDGAARARDLLEAARSIDQVSKLVGTIAGTVNLLSLNATIEAARAGDAGKGFAVVAREIRKLSDDAKDASQVIGIQMQTLRSGIEQVASDYHEVETAISSMANVASDIDDAVSAEADTTRLIARSVAEAGSASATIEQAVTTIAQSVRSASSSARDLDKMANALRNGATALGGSVEDFLREVRAA
jgi:methyl-accepting chemotaxis protein